MPKYEVDALGGNFEMTVEAETRTDAEGKALAKLRERFEHTVSTGQIEVYKVTFHDNTNARVLASTMAEARNNAEEWIIGKFERAREGSDLNQDARDIFNDLNPGVKDVANTDDRHYEINRRGRWEEGSIDE